MKAVANTGLNAEICSFVRTLKSDVDLALQCDVDSVHLVVPVSDLHIERKLQHLETEARRAFTEQSRLRRSSRSHRVA